MASQDHGIHSFEECVQEGSDYLQQTLGRVHKRRRSTHKKRREDGSNWRSISHNSKNIPQAMRNIKNSILEEPLIHLKNLDKKWCFYEWRRWWSWNKESIHETNKVTYKKRRMRRVPKNKWRQFKIHSNNPEWRMMTRMWCWRFEGKSLVSSI